MIKKILIGIVTAGMILITIPTVNSEDEITLNEVTDQIIDISDKYMEIHLHLKRSKKKEWSIFD